MVWFDFLKEHHYTKVNTFTDQNKNPRCREYQYMDCREGSSVTTRCSVVWVSTFSCPKLSKWWYSFSGTTFTVVAFVRLHLSTSEKYMRSLKSDTISLIWSPIFSHSNLIGTNTSRDKAWHLCRFSLSYYGFPRVCWSYIYHIITP